MLQVGWDVRRSPAQPPAQSGMPSKPIEAILNEKVLKDQLLLFVFDSDATNLQEEPELQITGECLHCHPCTARL